MKIAILTAVLVICVAKHYGRCQTIDQILEAAQTSADGEEAMDHPDGDDSIVIEWDMVFDREELEEFRSESSFGSRSSRRRRKRKARSNARLRWTDNTIPYTIYGFNDEEKDQIFEAIREWTDATCLNFRPRKSSDANYVYFVPVPAGCNSRVGMKGGPQPIQLAPSCINKTTIAHEIGHAIGFVHEQTRPDRDQYVTIESNNIKNGREHNFDINSIFRVYAYGIDYDYLSLMHYGQYAFGKAGRRTIRTTDPSYQDRIGKAVTLSSRDIELANAMYDCPGNGGQGLDAPECSNESETGLCEFMKFACADESMRINCKKTCGYC